MEIFKVKSMKTAQCAIGSMCKKNQSCGPCHDKISGQVGNDASTQLVCFCHDYKSEQVICSEQEQDAKHTSKIHDLSNTKSLKNNLRQCPTFFNNVLIDSWQCQIKIGNVKSQSIKWQCQIDIVDLKLLSACSIDHSRQCQSDLSITLSFIDQSSSTFQLVVASVSNNNTLSLDNSIDRLSVCSSWFLYQSQSSTRKFNREHFTHLLGLRHIDI
jgi:hypothetical protein